MNVHTNGTMREEVSGPLTLVTSRHRESKGNCERREYINC